MNVTLVPLSGKDAQYISERIHGWWLEMYSRDISTGTAGLESIFSREEAPEHILEHISEGTVYCNLECEGKVVGMAAYKVSAEAFFIDKLYLDSSSRGMGIGGESLETLIDIARSHGCTKVLLHVSPGNKSAYRFYLNHGFVFDYIEEITDCFGAVGERHHLIRLL